VTYENCHVLGSGVASALARNPQNVDARLALVRAYVDRQDAPLEVRVGIGH